MKINRRSNNFLIGHLKSLSLVAVLFLLFGLVKVFPLAPLKSLPFGKYTTSYYASIKQPIAYNHQIHVEENGMACEACHTQARRSEVAGVPSVNSCIGCHVSIKGTTAIQQREIAKISEHWKNNEPILWKSIHDLPDFVRFSHKSHLEVGFDCSNCHGEVSKAVMPVPQAYKKEIPLSMGWCVSCHRTDWPVASDGKVSIPVRETRGGTIIAESKPVVGHITGPVDCLACHR